MLTADLITGENAQRLLSAIFQDEEITTQRVSPSAESRTDSLERWQKFRHELMHVNRFFPQGTIDLERLKKLLPYLRVSAAEFNRDWYRARLQVDEAPFAIDQMGAPPHNKVPHGRANPAGIPYLYLASSVETAIGEIRPHPGEKATVAEFRLAVDGQYLDLRHPRKTISPFQLSDEQELDEHDVALLRGDIEFLAQLGEELTRPVVPQAGAINYIPSQYVCELAKLRGFSGVIYRSSVTEGINLALFDAAALRPVRLRQHAVTRVIVEAPEVQP